MRATFRRMWLSLAVVAVLASAAQAEVRPNAYVLAVGVDQYAKIKKLNGCVNDGKNAAAMLKKQSGRLFGKVDTRLLLNQEASKQAIEKELRWLGGVGKAGDFVVLFLSGHGDRNGKSWSFMPQDFDRAQPNMGVADTTILDLADKLAGEGKKVWIIVDACYSGQLRVNAKAVLNRHQDPSRGGIIVMVSSVPHQTSIAMGPYSAFAHAIGQALGGEADYDNDGKVTLKEARRFVYTRVHELLGGGQDGEIDYSLSLSDSLVLAHAKPAIVHRGRLTPLDGLDTVRPGRHRKIYEVKLAAGEKVQIDLMSGDGRQGPHNPGYFDAFVRLEDAQGNVIDANDDGGDGRNSRLTVQARVTGTYRVIVSSFAEGAVGDFELRIR